MGDFLSVFCHNSKKLIFFILLFCLTFANANENLCEFCNEELPDYVINYVPSYQTVDYGHEEYQSK